MGAKARGQGLLGMTVYTLPLACAKAAFDKYCNKEWQEGYYVNQIRKNYQQVKGANPWQIKEEFFAGKCSGKLVPLV